MLASIVLPIPNGCFMPTFLIGASTGRLYGELIQNIFGYTPEEMPSAFFAVVGAAALTGGTTQTLSTALITLELTGQQRLLTPVLIGVIVSCGVSGLLYAPRGEHGRKTRHWRRATWRRRRRSPP